jgi:hypothetical protein
LTAKELVDKVRIGILTFIIKYIIKNRQEIFSDSNNLTNKILSKTTTMNRIQTFLDHKQTPDIINSKQLIPLKASNSNKEL